jgi:hypothetical protein
MTGITPNWDTVKGAKEAVDDPNSPVSTIYTFAGA